MDEKVIRMQQPQQPLEPVRLDIHLPGLNDLERNSIWQTDDGRDALNRLKAAMALLNVARDLLVERRTRR